MAGAGANAGGKEAIVMMLVVGFTIGILFCIGVAEVMREEA